MLIRTGQWDEAETVLTEGAGLAAGNPQLIGTIACNQGALAAYRQDWALATERFEAAIAASQTGGHPHDVIEAMIGLAETMLRFTEECQSGHVTSFVFIYHSIRPGVKNCHSKIAGFGSKQDLDHLIELLREGLAKREFEREEGHGRD